jgi:hypothetical protein
MTTAVEIEIDLRVLLKCMFHVMLHFQSDQGITALTSGGLPPRDTDQQPKPSDYKSVCHIPEHLLNEGGYSIWLVLVEDATRPTSILDDIDGPDVKDLSPRPVGSWHGREPGPVKKKFYWSISARV